MSLLFCKHFHAFSCFSFVVFVLDLVFISSFPSNKNRLRRLWGWLWLKVVKKQRLKKTSTGNTRFSPKTVIGAYMVLSRFIMQANNWLVHQQFMQCVWFLKFGLVYSFKKGLNHMNCALAWIIMKKILCTLLSHCLSQFLLLHARRHHGTHG